MNETIKLMDDKNHYRIMSELLNPYGDGKACEKIVDFFIKLN
mgnify:FL=1